MASPYDFWKTATPSDPAWMHAFERISADHAEVTDSADTAIERYAELAPMAAEAYWTGDWSLYNAKLSQLIQTDLLKKAQDEVDRERRAA